MVERNVTVRGREPVEGKAEPRPRPRVRPNVEVRLVLRERVRKDPDRSVHMSHVKIPGPG